MRRVLAFLLIFTALAGCGKEKEQPSTIEGTVEEIYTFGREGAQEG